MHWTTLSEFDNDYFTIERSGDAYHFETMDSIFSAGNSQTPMHYSALDQSPFYGLSYYRLKQTDLDGQYTYSAIRPISIVLKPEVQIYPNPMSDFVTVSVNGSSLHDATIQIFDIQGKLHYHNTIETDQKEISIKEISSLDDGTYLFLLRAGGVHYSYVLEKVGK